MNENLVSDNPDTKTRTKAWLNESAANITPQYGEDGFIEKILSIVNNKDKFCVEFVQPSDISVTQGSSLRSIAMLGKSKGYELVAVTVNNAIFVAREYFSLFGIADNSIDMLWTDQSAVSHIFCGYDGTIFIRGCGMMPWQTIPIKESRVQQLPERARMRVGDPNPLRRKLGKYFRRLRSRGKI